MTATLDQAWAGSHIRGTPGSPGAGLVERSPSSRSRRAVSVRLTAGGHDLLGSTVRELLEHEADLLSPLAAAAQRTAWPACSPGLGGHWLHDHGIGGAAPGWPAQKLRHTGLRFVTAGRG
jgi:hypothetical protein